jgi:dimethylaniline monooxygenase (N-oxide forming)
MTQEARMNGRVGRERAEAARRSASRIAIVGAGFSGLAAAKVLGRFGHDVSVFERCAEVGGVWSSQRRYPGLRTQNVKSTYAFSDFPFPCEVPEWPTGDQVQAYLAAYVERFALADRLRLGTEVVAAELDEAAATWTLHTADVAAGTSATDTFDHLVVANGIFCDPLVPAFAGGEEHAAAGGRVLHTTEPFGVDEARGRDIVVVGYGKSACDVAEAVSEVAAGTNLVARNLLWKMPRRVAGVLNYKYLMLTRLGEALFRHPEPRGIQRLLHARRLPLARRMLGAVEAVATRQDRLRRLGLVPRGSFEDIARSTVSLTTDRFFAKVRRGQIAVHRDAEVKRLLADGPRAMAELTDGTRVGADLVLCGTGYRQRVPFLGEALQRRITDRRGNFELYRQVLPLHVPHLTFSGYNSSFFSPLSAEIAALWTANLLMGALARPPAEEMRAQVHARLRWMEERTQGRHARGANIIPFSMRNIDELLADIGLDVSRVTRLRQCLLPIDPRAYRSIEERLLERQATLDERKSAALSGATLRAPEGSFS